MRRTLFPLLLLVTAACATAPQRMPGRYGLVFDSDLTRSAPGGSFSDQMTLALKDRLASVEVVGSPSASGYDAVIVIRRGGTVVGPPGHPAPRGPIVYDRDGRPVSPSNPSPYVTMIEFDVLRDGRTVASGAARLENEPVLDSIDRSGRTAVQPVNTRNGYEQSRQVALAVVASLRRNAG